MTLSDFYASWLKLNRQIENQVLETDFATLLRDHLELRKSDLLENAAMLAAIYLDARVRFSLTGSQIIAAKMHLKKLHERVESNKRSNSMDTSSDAVDADLEGSFEVHLGS